MWAGNENGPFIRVRNDGGLLSKIGLFVPVRNDGGPGYFQIFLLSDYTCEISFKKKQGL